MHHSPATDTPSVADPRDPTLAPVTRRAAAPRPVDDGEAIKRLLADLPWHPYVWAYRGALAVSAGLLIAALMVLSAPTWSESAAVSLRALDAANGFPLPLALLGASALAAFNAAMLFRGAVRLGRTYAPIGGWPPVQEATPRPAAPRDPHAATPWPVPGRNAESDGHWSYEIGV